MTRTLEETRARLNAWVAYIGGFDIRQSCGSGVPDRLRLVIRRASPERYGVLEVIKEPVTAGGLVLQFEIESAAAVDRPPGPPADAVAARVPPRDYAVLLYRLDAAGAFRAAPMEEVVPGGPADRPGAWLLSACRAGRFYRAADRDDRVPPLPVLQGNGT